MALASCPPIVLVVISDVARNKHAYPLLILLPLGVFCFALATQLRIRASTGQLQGTLPNMTALFLSALSTVGGWFMFMFLRGMDRFDPVDIASRL